MKRKYCVVIKGYRSANIHFPLCKFNIIQGESEYRPYHSLIDNDVIFQQIEEFYENPNVDSVQVTTMEEQEDGTFEETAWWKDNKPFFANVVKDYEDSFEYCFLNASDLADIATNILNAKLHGSNIIIPEDLADHTINKIANLLNRAINKNRAKSKIDITLTDE